jgi:hypothetical protein
MRCVEYPGTFNSPVTRGAVGVERSITNSGSICRNVLT